MAATLSNLSQLNVPRLPWDQVSRPSSQPQPHSRDERRGDRKSPNRVKSKPANPIVINSILGSFDVLTPSPVLASDGPVFEPASPHPRPRTAYDTFGSSPSLITGASPGFGMEYGTGLSMNDESGRSNAALPPTVRTSRDHGHITDYKASRPPSLWSSNGDELRRSSSLGSRRSFSLRRKEKERAGKFKLSSESWVKQGTRNTASVEKGWSRDDGHNGIQHESSQESLKPPKSRLELNPILSMSSTVSRAEQIIALTSTPRSAGPKRRLYLTDTGSNESESIFDSSAPIVEAPEPDENMETSVLPLDENVDLTIQENLEDYVKVEEEQSDSTRRSPQKNAIVDSIPMRTSSLRQSSSSPGREKKKDRKSKRRSEIGRMAKMKAGNQRDSFVSSSSKEISDSTWNDLGEDDETVKRIRELREQRNARMLEPKVSSVREISPGTNSEVSNPSVSGQRSTSTEESKASSFLRPDAVRCVTEPSPLSRRVHRPESDLYTPDLNKQHTDNSKPNQNSSDPKRRTVHLSLDESKSQLRPLTARSNASSNPALSLDYSYLDAVDALQGVRREIRKEIPNSPASPVIPSTPTRSTPVAPTKTQSPKVTTETFRSRSFRWKLPAVHHPDLPLAFDKSARRRSTSVDIGIGHLAAQADPVEVAVNDYLRAKRLNRKIKHPLSGRTVSFSEVGDPNGAAVIVCLGMGLTRYVSAFYDELAATLRLRLVTIDRPGVGNSDPYPQSDKSGPLSWPDDVLAVCQHLGISKFSVLAHSAGAIYALATALILPHLMKGKLHLLSPWIPPSQLEAFSYPMTSASPGGALPRSQRILRVLPTPFFKAANASFMTSASTSLRPASKSKTKTEPRQSTPSSAGGDVNAPPTRDGRGPENNRRESLMLMDQFMPEINPTNKFPVQRGNLGQNGTHRASPVASPTNPTFEFVTSGQNAPENIAAERKHEYITLLTQRTWELATRDSNPATDLLVCLERHRDIGFRYTDVHQEVVITHGSEDKRVPIANVKWLAEQMNRHSFAFGASGSRTGSAGECLVAGGCEIRVLDGEGHGLMANPLIMGDILTEIAGYWSGRST